MTTNYRDLDRKPVRGDVDVRIGFPTYMGGTPEEREASARKGAVIIEITDGPSHSRIVEIRLSAEQFTTLLSGGTAQVSDAWLPPGDKMTRIGKTVEWTSQSFGYGQTEAAESQADLYRTQGWEEVSVRRTNSGLTVHARRWA